MTSLLDTAAKLHIYVDDNQVYIHCRYRDVNVAAFKIESCVAAINNWMASNRLQLNPSKTELVWFASLHGLMKFIKPPINVGQTKTRG